MGFYTRKYQENTKLLSSCKFIVDVLMVILVSFFLIYFSCSRALVNGNSMANAVNNDETVLINRMAYAFSKPERFDVIAFGQDSIDSSKVYIKRVIGLPGETVQILNGKVYINDEVLNDIIDTTILTAGIASTKIKLEENEYFVLGDNRNSSEDSRFSSIGMVKTDIIKGKVWMVISPFNSIKFVK